MLTICAGQQMTLRAQRRRQDAHTGQKNGNIKQMNKAGPPRKEKNRDDTNKLACCCCGCGMSVQPNKNSSNPKIIIITIIEGTTRRKKKHKKQKTRIRQRRNEAMEDGFCLPLLSRGGTDSGRVGGAAGREAQAIARRRLRSGFGRRKERGIRRVRAAAVPRVHLVECGGTA